MHDAAVRWVVGSRLESVTKICRNLRDRPLPLPRVSPAVLVQTTHSALHLYVSQDHFNGGKDNCRIGMLQAWQHALNHSLCIFGVSWHVVHHTVKYKNLRA